MNRRKVEHVHGHSLEAGGQEGQPLHCLGDIQRHSHHHQADYYLDKFNMFREIIYSEAKKDCHYNTLVTYTEIHITIQQINQDKFNMFRGSYTVNRRWPTKVSILIF